MIKQILRWSVKNRIMILLLAAIIIAVGIYTIYNTPVDAIPDLSDVQVIIKTNYPGQAPQVVEDQVTYPLTTAMLSVPGATAVRGYSFFGDSYVYIIFKDGTDPYWARARVLEYLSQASGQLPNGIKPQLGPDATGVGWIYNYVLVDKTHKYDLSQLRSIQDWNIKYALQTVPGVAEIATIGGMVKQYQVTVLPNKLRAYHITLQQIQQAIKSGNQEVSGSVIELAEAEYMVRARGYIKSISDLKNIPIRLRKNGVAITLGDVAKISLGPTSRRGIADLNGQGEVVGGVVVMRQGANALRTIAAIKSRLHDIQKTLPKGVQIVETYNRAGLIKRSISTLRHKLIEEFIVVGLICLLFLFHIRSSMVVIITLPIGILLAFIIMYIQGINANIMSLGGIAIAIGAMVDAAIVMIENLHKHLERNGGDKGHWDVVQESVLEVGPALFFSLAIITLSFLPVFTLTGQEGRLFAPLAYTKTYAMAASALLAVTLVPVLMGYLVRGKIIAEAKNPFNKMLICIYKPVIHFVLKYPKTICVVTIMIVVSGFLPLRHLGSEFMPDLNEGDLMYMPSTFPAISIGKAQQLLQQTDLLIKSVPEVKSVFGKIGRAETATDPAPLTMIESIIQLKHRDKWRPGMTISKIKQELNSKVKIPGVTNTWVMPIKTRLDMLATGIKTPLGLKITGPSLKTIEQIGTNIEKLLKPIPGTASIYSERVAGGRYVDIDINRLKAARLGLNIADVQNIISSAVGGMIISQTVEGLERYPINIRYPQDYRNSLQKLQWLPIVTANGAHIPLGDIAKISISNGPSLIKSENARPTGWVLIDINGRDIQSYVKSAKVVLNNKLTLPTGYAIHWSGQYEYMQRAKSRLQIIIPLTLMIIIILLYLNFKSISEVVLILGTLPLSLVGGIWLMYLLDYRLSVAAGIGFISLAGVSIEIGIVMIVYLNQALNKKQGKEDVTYEIVHAAILEGALQRVRPIFMTVSTVIIGLLPIMFDDGTGSEVMRRIAAPMVGGMISASLLALLLIPAVYLLWKSPKARTE